MSNPYQAHYARAVARNLGYWGQRIQQSSEQELIDLLAENENLRNAVAEGLEYPSIFTEVAQFALNCFPFIFINDLGHQWETTFQQLVSSCPATSQELRCELLLRLGHLNRIAPGGGTTEQAHDYLREALHLAECIGDDLLKGRCYIHLAALYRRQQDLKRALGYALKGVAMLPEATAGKHIGSAHGLLGRLYGQLDDYAKARHHLEQAVQVFRQLAIANELTRALINLAYIALEAGDSACAMATFREANEHLDAIADERLKGTMRLNWGVALAQQESYQEAESTLRQIDMRSFYRLGDWRLVALTMQSLGNVLFLQAKLNEATPFLQEAISAWEKLPLEPGQGNSIGTLGQVKAAAGDKVTGIRLLSQAVALLEQFPDDAFAVKLREEFTGDLEKLSGPSLR